MSEDYDSILQAWITQGKLAVGHQNSNGKGELQLIKAIEEIKKIHFDDFVFDGYLKIEEETVIIKYTGREGWNKRGELELSLGFTEAKLIPFINTHPTLYDCLCRKEQKLQDYLVPSRFAKQ